MIFIKTSATDRGEVTWEGGQEAKSESHEQLVLT